MIKIGIGLIIIFIAFIPCSSCDSFIEEDEELILSREDYAGNQLRLNGIYYKENIDTTKITRYALYRNGIVRFLNISSKARIFEDFPDASGKSNWGVFLIEGDNITIEKWSPGPAANYVGFTQKGAILNDTTFQILERYDNKSESDERRAFNHVYHFVPFSPKPDSTNIFID
jgi:hypothetical protein